MIISVASGKGGTGKTTVSTSLALALDRIRPVLFLDCDVEEPNAHIFLKPAIATTEKVHRPIPMIDYDKCTYCQNCSDICAFNVLAVLEKTVLIFGELCHSCGSCWYQCPEKAITQTDKEIGLIESGKSQNMDFSNGKLNIGEAMSPPLIKAVKAKISPKKTTIIDAPPGTSCPVITSVKDTDFCILVTEPTPFGLNDLKLSVEMLREIGVPCGVIVNRADIGNDDVLRYCTRENIPLLMQIPFDRKIASLYAKGTPIVVEMPEYIEKFQNVYFEIERMVQS
ncbi:Cobyrinic acid ac-diamide synthase [Desulfofarcimen acetoxidans DSM 771]|jgi:MinD superfamily P-loop ATPase|uniref:Cobyrinic acid ac-diamide synthase n=1 Tax=Desulfofarcimen acetoxidans (strain ATCC 49208 / DSM 771 / KCTC 5769 / VKM B-1644 / 5575) TaxID=485916 RepID=C8W5D6_DESAS|nr:ATP-binding protein [Desulfofarcimen acetoxidans]ACV62118.1 Cobyrinic acid ac-diamide synthase [Desulfofarcimen acetoxidans DSM 771]